MMDFRQYDGALGKFNVIDPLAEIDHDMTTYHFGLNNPVFCSDPTGLNVINHENGIYFDGADAQAFFNAYLQVLGGSKVESFEVSGSIYDFSSYGDDMFNITLPQIVLKGNSSSWGTQFEHHVYSNSPFYYGSKNYDLSGLRNATFGLGLEHGNSVMYNKSTWFSLKQWKTYNQRFNGNGATWGKNAVAKKVSTGFKIAGYAMGVYGAYSINEQYNAGEIDTLHMTMEQSSNAISTFGGIYGAVWGIGWELGRITTQTGWYQEWRDNTWLQWRYENLGY